MDGRRDREAAARGWNRSKRGNEQRDSVMNRPATDDKFRAPSSGDSVVPIISPIATTSRGWWSWKVFIWCTNRPCCFIPGRRRRCGPTAECHCDWNNCHSGDRKKVSVFVGMNLLRNRSRGSR